MQGFALCLSFLFHFISVVIAAGGGTQRYKPTDYFLLNCGASSKTASEYDRRDWDTDDHYLQFMPTNAAAISFPATTAAEQSSSVPQVPFATARIFASELTYSFPVSPGQKFLRLYFYSVQYSAQFSVTANEYTLLKNFSALSSSPESFIRKEFVINVDDQQLLNLTFKPSPDYFAFVNGIEIVSMPSALYIRGDDYPIRVVTDGQGSNFDYLDNSTAMETLFRLNVGGKDVGPKDDTGMFREWSEDDDYVVGLGYQTPTRNVQVYYTQDTPAYSAPDIVYTTSRTIANYSDNILWLFPVDSGFRYLFRFYFCEFEREVRGRNQRVFRIDIDNVTAEKNADVIEWANGRPQVPVMKDYLIFVNDRPENQQSKQNVSLLLRPSMEQIPMFANAILNGLEIFKLNDSTGNLAVPDPEIPATRAQPPEKKGRKAWVAIPGGVIGGIALLLLVILITFLIFRRRWRKAAAAADSALTVTKSSWVPMPMDSMSTRTGGSTGSHLPFDLCRSFSLAELKLATRNFNDAFVVGRGGFGKVYRGYIDGGATAVAIKRLNPESSQGFREFQTEIKLLSTLRHVHLMSLIGYCDQDEEMILVYDYMSRGTLRDHLYASAENPPLPWKQRLMICIGAAKGLQYLHGGAKHPIIHRDVKSTNILLDDNWVAKLSDFGLSRVGPMGGSVSHVTTLVKGSVGYVDPEYYRLQKITDKSDVYSFGVVLFEVLCARPAMAPRQPKHRVSLAAWGRHCYETGSIREIVDSNLKGQIAPECLKQYTEIAYTCLKDEGIDRPKMSDVLWRLEFAMQLQDAAEKRCRVPEPSRTFERSSSALLGNDGNYANHVVEDGDDDDDEDNNNDEFSTNMGDENVMLTTKSSYTVTSTSDSGRVQSHTVFSELNNQLGC